MQEVSLQCHACGKMYSTLYLTKKYCSRSCLQKNWKSNNRERDLAQRRAFSKKFYARKRIDFTLPNRECTFCHKNLTLTTRNYSSKKFCNFLCSNNYWKKQNPEKWKSVKVAERIRNRSKYKLRNAVHHDQIRFGGNRQLVLDRDHYTCGHCKKGPLPRKQLVIHHIDGRGTGLAPEQQNNILENLIVLCRSCHMREHHHASR